jgi:hypothetical protein
MLLTFDNKRRILAVDVRHHDPQPSRSMMKGEGIRLVLMVAAFSLVLTRAGAAQTLAPAAFELASIKPDDTGGNYIEATRGTVIALSATPALCLMWAYGVQSSEVSAVNSDVSALLQSARYTIVVKAADPVPDSQLKMMFQTLPTAQASPKLARRCQWTTMGELATSLGEDFSLAPTPYLTSGERPDISAMMVTIREQLGLKLESRRAATDVLVIDHLEKPAAN